ncbi:MAG: TrmH family RNA methyltransferase [Anaerolineae bacterium]
MKSETKLELANWLPQFVTPERYSLINKILAMRTRRITTVLENIFQPHNASAVLRSCDIFGIQDVHIIEDAYEYTVNPEVAMGASRWLTLHRYGQPEPLPAKGTRGMREAAEARKALATSTPDCINQLKRNGYTVVATSLRPGAVSLYDLPIDKPLALCFGTEETGLSDAAHELADVYMTIPMFGFTQSFNISVSAALSLQHLTHKLRQDTHDWQLSQAEAAEVRLDWLIKSATKGDALVRQFLKDRGEPIPEEFMPEPEADD